MSLALGDILDLKIDKLSFGGAGVARSEGMVIFVSDTAPGDIVKARLTKVKKNYCEAVIHGLDTPGPKRRLSPCVYAEKCGGCQWQHITYDEQLKQKHLILTEQFAKSSNLKGLLIPPLIHGSESRYRNRVQVHTQKGEFGFFQKKTNQLVPIKDCLITDKKLTLEISNQVSKSKSSKLRRLEAFITETGGVKTNWNAKSGAADGFSQVNSAMNHEMLNWVAAEFDSHQSTEFVDLYSGNGNFTRFLELRHKEASFTAVELSEPATRLGQKLSTQDGRIQWVNKSVEDFLSSNKIPKDALVLIDPPRIGCSKEVIAALGSTNISRVLYISCNPSTFQRDVDLLSETRGLKVIKVAPIDMFPNTYHIEIMALIELSPQD